MVNKNFNNHGGQCFAHKIHGGLTLLILQFLGAGTWYIEYGKVKHSKQHPHKLISP